MAGARGLDSIEHYCQYSVTSDERSFVARAVGDLDGHGIQSTFQRFARLSECVALDGAALEIYNELE